MTSFNQPEHDLKNQDLTKITKRLSKKLAQDNSVHQLTFGLRNSLKADRVVLYYFYRQWKGQVTFESLSNSRFSILGMTGADQCFNDQYAAMYLEGRVKATTDIAVEPMSECHREFLQSIEVKANLVVPVLTNQSLWGLLVAHHCQNIHPWSDQEILLMQQTARTLATSVSSLP